MAADVVVVTLATGDNYQQIVEEGIKNKRLYCNKHKYRFVHETQYLDPTRPPAWSKILLLLQVMDHYEEPWLFWTDADSLIMNLSIPLTELIDENYNLIISKDQNGINSGEFLIRNCDWSRQLLKSAYMHSEFISHPWYEQMAIMHLLDTEPSWLSKMKCIPQRLFNSCVHMYQRGDFILHFAGNHDPALLHQLMTKYATQVIDDQFLLTLDDYLGIYGFHLSPPHSEKNEGYMSEPQKKQFIQLLQQHPHIENIVEIGLNGGHSAEMFFQNCPSLKHFLSFDIKYHTYTPVAVEYFTRKYKHRFTFIEGDSSVTVPKYTASHQTQKYDLIYIDGGHLFEQCLNDILHCKDLATPNTVLWIDDAWDGGVKGAIRECEHRGVISVDNEYISDDTLAGGRCFISAHYIF